jgi:hypothetical protein
MNKPELTAAGLDHVLKPVPMDSLLGQQVVGLFHSDAPVNFVNITYSVVW